MREAAAGVPGALVATPLFAASKAVYLDRRGQMPEPEAQVMRSRLSGLRRRGSWADADEVAVFGIEPPASFVRSRWPTATARR